MRDRARDRSLAQPRGNDLHQLAQRQRVAARAQPAGGERAARVQALADDVDPVLVGDAQPQVRASAPRPRRPCSSRCSTVRCQVGTSGSVNSHWNVVAPLEPVLGVDLAADRVEQQRDRLGVALGRALAHADHARLRERAPALGDLQRRQTGRQQRRSGQRLDGEARPSAAWSSSTSGPRRRPRRRSSRTPSCSVRPSPGGISTCAV